MYLYHLAVVTVLVLSSVLADFSWDDPCYKISPNNWPRSSQEHDVYILNFTRECPEGRVRWDTPRGTFQVNFAPLNKVAFSICLKAGHANFIHKMFTIVDGEKVPVTIPTEGTDSCVQSHDSEIQLLLVAPPEFYYVTWIDFVTKLS